MARQKAMRLVTLPSSVASTDWRGERAASDDGAEQRRMMEQPWMMEQRSVGVTAVSDPLQLFLILLSTFYTGNAHGMASRL